MTLPTPARRVAASTALTLAALVGLVGCTSDQQEPSMDQTAVATNSETTRTTAFTTADHTADLIRTLNPDLQLELDFDPRRDQRWYNCSEDTTAGDEVPPKFIQWIAERNFYLEPHRETASLVEPIARRLVADGWTARPTPGGGEASSITLDKDGFVVTVGGETEASADRVSTIGLDVASPCIPAPDNILDWKATASPTPTP